MQRRYMSRPAASLMSKWRERQNCRWRAASVWPGASTGARPALGIGHAALVQKLPRSLAHAEMAREAEL
jgi:hypothetical protein